MTPRTGAITAAATERRGTRSADVESGDTGDLAGTWPTKEQHRSLGGLALVIVLAAQLVVVLDFSIVNVALPSLSAELGVSADGAQWVVTAYALTFGGLLVLGDGPPTSSGGAERSPSGW